MTVGLCLNGGLRESGRPLQEVQITPRIVREVLGGSPVEFLQDPARLDSCLRLRLTWAERCAFEEVGSTELTDEVDAGRTLLRELPELYGPGVRGRRYGELLPEDHPFRRMYIGA